MSSELRPVPAIRLSRECFEFWRHLWDDLRTDTAIIFVGGGDCYQVLSSEPMLSSRVYIWQEFRRLSTEQVLAAIPAFHPIWADVDPADIAFTDDNAAHGNFRAWAKITKLVDTALKRLRREAREGRPGSPRLGVQQTRRTSMTAPLTSTSATSSMEHPVDRGLAAADWAPEVIVVLDPGDDATVTRAALHAHDPTRGRITDAPTPATGQRPVAAILGSDVLVALGKPADGLAAQQASGPARSWQIAAAWILADHVQQVIVLRGHRLDRPTWVRLLALRRHTGIHLLVVHHRTQLGETTRTALREVRHQITGDLGAALAETAAAFEAFPHVIDHPWPDDDAAPLPRLPASEVLRFRADAWRWLSRGDFARVDACYTHGLRTAEGWLAAHRGQPTRSTAVPARIPVPRGHHGAGSPGISHAPLPVMTDGRSRDDGGAPFWGEEAPARLGGDRFEALQLMLSKLTATSPSPRHTVARLRGAQAGFLRHGLALELPARLALLTGPGLGSVPFSGEVAARIRAGAVHPVAAATLAVMVFTGLDHATVVQVAPDALAGAADAGAGAGAGTLRIPVASPGGSRPGSVTFFVPPAGRGLLQAAALFRDLRDRPTPYLLGHAAAGTTIAGFHAAAQACGLPILTDPVPTAGAGGWLARAGCYQLMTPRVCSTGW